MCSKAQAEKIVRELKRSVAPLFPEDRIDAILFGSYARGDATPLSDLDIVVVGGHSFVGKNIFALAEDLRELTGKDADVFELREVNKNTPFYDSVMRDGIKIA